MSNDYFAKIKEIDQLLRKSGITLTSEELRIIQEKNELLKHLKDGKTPKFAYIYNLEILVFAPTDDLAQNWIRNDMDFTDSFFDYYKFTGEWKIDSINSKIN